MPRAILTFNLPREQSEFELAQAAPTLASSLAEVARVLRDREKYGNPRKAERELIAKLREAIDFKALERAGW